MPITRNIYRGNMTPGDSVTFAGTEGNYTWTAPDRVCHVTVTAAGAPGNPGNVGNAGNGGDAGNDGQRGNSGSDGNGGEGLSLIHI